MNCNIGCCIPASLHKHTHTSKCRQSLINVENEPVWPVLFPTSSPINHLVYMRPLLRAINNAVISLRLISNKKINQHSGTVLPNGALITGTPVSGTQQVTIVSEQSLQTIVTAPFR